MIDTEQAKKPNCYDCVHRIGIPGDCHSSCANRAAKVAGSLYGIRAGWFMWPFNFDPTWLVSCDGYQPKAVAEKHEGSAAQ